LSAANEMLRIVARAPDEKKIDRWIAAARKAVNPEAPVKTIVKPGAATPPVEGAPPRARGRARKTDAATPLGEVTAVRPADAIRAETEPEVIADPVNFEADPDVREMLALAPLALPIPARMLAEKGIAPSEVPVAPVLNRAVGDLDVRV